LNLGHLDKHRRLAIVCGAHRPPVVHQRQLLRLALLSDRCLRARTKAKRVVPLLWRCRYDHHGPPPHHLCTRSFLGSLSHAIPRKSVDVSQLPDLRGRTAAPYFPDNLPSCPVCQQNYDGIFFCAQAAPVFANVSMVVHVGRKYAGSIVSRCVTVSQIILNPGAFIDVILYSCNDTFQHVYSQCVDWCVGIYSLVYIMSVRRPMRCSVLSRPTKQHCSIRPMSLLLLMAGGSMCVSRHVGRRGHHYRWRYDANSGD